MDHFCGCCGGCGTFGYVRTVRNLMVGCALGERGLDVLIAWGLDKALLLGVFGFYVFMRVLDVHIGSFGEFGWYEYNALIAIMTLYQFYPSALFGA